jgi:hypothetical protein
MKSFRFWLIGLLIFLAGCTQQSNHSKGVYMLLDTSGTYAVELNKARSIINYLLGTLQPGDTMGVGRIDTGSLPDHLWPITRSAFFKTKSRRL